MTKKMQQFPIYIYIDRKSEILTKKHNGNGQTLIIVVFKLIFS